MKTVTMVDVPRETVLRRGVPGLGATTLKAVPYDPSGFYGGRSHHDTFVYSDIRPSTRAIHAAGLRRRGFTYPKIAKSVKVSVYGARALVAKGERWLRLCEAEG